MCSNVSWAPGTLSHPEDTETDTPPRWALPIVSPSSWEQRAVSLSKPPCSGQEKMLRVLAELRPAAPDSEPVPGSALAGDAANHEGRLGNCPSAVRGTAGRTRGTRGSPLNAPVHRASPTPTLAPSGTSGPEDLHSRARASWEKPISNTWGQATPSAKMPSLSPACCLWKHCIAYNPTEVGAIPRGSSHLERPDSEPLQQAASSRVTRAAAQPRPALADPRQRTLRSFLTQGGGEPPALM